MGLAVYERALWALVSNTSLDVLHFSLHPLSAGRLSVAFALVLLHAAVMWIAVAIIRAAATRHARLAPSRAGVAGNDRRRDRRRRRDRPVVRTRFP